MNELERNKKIAVDWLDCILKGHRDGGEERIVAMMDPDCKYWIAGETHASGFMDRESWLEVWRQSCHAIGDDCVFTLGYITAEEDRVTVEAESHGTVPFSGKHYNNQYHWLFRISDGKVTEFKEYFDTQHGFTTLDIPLGSLDDERGTNLDVITHRLTRN